MDLIKKYCDKYKEFISYSAVGISLTLVNWVLYSILIHTMPMVTANMFSWGIVVILAYIGNKVFVFESHNWEIRTVIRELVSYIGARGVTGTVEVFAQPMLYTMGINQPLFGVDGLTAKIIVSIFVMVLNYSCTKLLVFGGAGGEQGC